MKKNLVGTKTTEFHQSASVLSAIFLLVNDDCVCDRSADFFGTMELQELDDGFDGKILIFHVHVHFFERGNSEKKIADSFRAAATAREEGFLEMKDLAESFNAEVVVAVFVETALADVFEAVGLGDEAEGAARVKELFDRAGGDGGEDWAGAAELGGAAGALVH